MDQKRAECQLNVCDKCPAFGIVVSALLPEYCEKMISLKLVLIANCRDLEVNLPGKRLILFVSYL